MEVVADGVVDKAFLLGGDAARLVLEDDVLVPSAAPRAELGEGEGGEGSVKWRGRVPAPPRSMISRNIRELVRTSSFTEGLTGVPCDSARGLCSPLSQQKLTGVALLCPHTTMPQCMQAKLSQNDQWSRCSHWARLSM